MVIRHFKEGKVKGRTGVFQGLTKNKEKPLVKNEYGRKFILEKSSLRLEGKRPIESSEVLWDRDLRDSSSGENEVSVHIKLKPVTRIHTGKKQWLGHSMGDT